MTGFTYVRIYDNFHLFSHMWKTIVFILMRLKTNRFVIYHSLSYIYLIINLKGMIATKGLIVNQTSVIAMKRVRNNIKIQYRTTSTTLSWAHQQGTSASCTNDAAMAPFYGLSMVCNYDAHHRPIVALHGTYVFGIENVLSAHLQPLTNQYQLTENISE